MKSTIKYLPLLLLLLSPGCDTVPPEPETAITLLIDLTDPLSVKPNADEITTHLALKENKWQGISVKVAEIADKDVNDSKTITLESENRWTGNTMIREAKAVHFTKELREALAPDEHRKPLGHSIICRSMANELNMLVASKAHEKCLLIYSDLMEHDEVDFYDPKTFALLKNNPDAIRRMLEKTQPLGDLSGIEIWLLYEPPTYEANNRYMTVAKFYEHLLESKGAKVHIGTTLNP